MRLRFLFLFPVIALYCIVFLQQEKLSKAVVSRLQPIPTAPFLQAATGYLRQLVAEIFFIQSSVYLGGVKPGTDPHMYAAALAHNYKQITSLYPVFYDPYFYSQSYLAYISPEYARAANDILTIGRKAYPENVIYPFFQGFNLFRYLDEPLEASKIFQEASLLPKAPPLFARLAIILAAEGGQLEAAIISLKALLNDPKADDATKHRYFEELVMFTDALTVQEAVKKFKAENGIYPHALEQLVPDYIPALPTFGTAFVLTWKSPNVGLKRP